MPTPQRIDIRKQLKPFYEASASPAILDIPPMKFLMIDGKGDPNTSPDYAAAVAALYSASFTLKFTLKRGPEHIDYPVMPLEGLWWADDPAVFAKGDRSKWRWTAMILQPEFISRAQVDTAIAAAEKKKPNPALAELRFATFTEGPAAQIMHVGPYSSEGPTVARLHAFIADQVGTLSGRHHEIYLSDPRRVAPEKIKTIIRQPFVLRTK